MSRLAYITPDKAPDTWECRRFFVPRGQTWDAIIAGALNELTRPELFEQVNGLSPEQTAAVFNEMWLLFDQEGCPMFAGMIVAAARSVTPSGWLLCDGTTYNAADYQSLYDAIGTAFGSAGAGTFKVPDLRGRGPIGAGSGADLTPRSLADTGGEEAHLLTTTEMPSHQHNVGIALSAAGTGGQIFVIGSQFNAGTTDTGGGEAHNNMPPFLALNFYIYAGQ